MKTLLRVLKLFIIVSFLVLINKNDVNKEKGIFYNDNSNKYLDLTAMAIKFEEIKMEDLSYPLDTYVGDLTAYTADCPLCGGTLGCTGQNVLDGTTTYTDKDYGTVRIMASSKSLQCGSIVRYDLNGEQITAIVLDRGVTGTDLDLLVSDNNQALVIGRRQLTYDVLRYGWSRKTS